MLPFLLNESRPAGLSTSFADVVVRNVPLGVPYIVRGSSGKGLVLQNLGDAPIRVRIQGILPSEGQLKESAQPLPDLGWLSIEPREMTIPAHHEGICRITLQIPHNSEYRGSQFQVMIWSQSIPLNDSHVSVSAALLSRLRFYIESKRL